MATPAGSNLQTLSALLQLKYIPGLQRQFNDSYPNLRYIRQNTTDITAEGDKAIIAIETGLNEAGGIHGESADVPSAVSPTVRTVQVSLKQMTFRARITWRLMKKARTTSNAFARGLDLTMRSTRDAMTLTANQYTYGDGSGVQGRVKAKNNGALTIDIDRAHGYSSGGVSFGGQPYMLIRPNQVLHILDTKTFTGGVSNDRGTFQVSTVDYETDASIVRAKVVVLTGAIANVQVDDYVYLQNSIAGWTDSDETVDNQPPMGFLGFYFSSLVDPLQGLTVATEPQWQGHPVPVAQATVISDMNKARDAYMKRAQTASFAYIISSYETRERWHDALVTKAEWRNVGELDGSWSVAVYSGRPWFADHTAPDTIAFIVPTGDKIQRYSASDFIEVINDDNSTLHLVPNKTMFDVLFSTLYEFGINRRNVLIAATNFNW